MQAVDEELETIHLYVVREEEKRPFTAVPLFFAFLCLVGIGAVTIYSGDHPYYEHTTLRVPAIFLPLKTFSATEPIIPTGIKTYPAMQAHGALTIYNGSILNQRIPAGMIFTTSTGIEVIADESAYVPAGDPPVYGIASILAHVVSAGSQGNIPSFAINEVYGTSLYIRNLHAFHGGKNSYWVPVVTAQDRETAIDAARAILSMQQATIQAYLASPCHESSQVKNGMLRLSWGCQFVTYSVPSSMRVTAIRLVGKILFVDVMFVPRPRIIMFK